MSGDDLKADGDDALGAGISGIGEMAISVTGVAFTYPPGGTGAPPGALWFDDADQSCLLQFVF